MLILLVALPFTAPFSTCDLSELVSTAHTWTLMWTPSGQSSASIEGSTLQAGPGSVLEEEQFKDGALSDTSVLTPVSSRAEETPHAVSRRTVVRSALVALRL